MKFEFPEYLYGLLLVSIPIFVHLFSFRQRRKVVFSNTSFLKDIQIQSSSRRKLKERLILLFRILAILFIILAFAKPYFSPPAAEQAVGKKIVCIYVDNSYSMEAVGREGTLFEEAKKKARELVNAYDVTDEFLLVSNKLSGEEDQILNKEVFLEKLDSLDISSQPNDLQKVLDFSESLSQRFPHQHQSLFLISDFQKNQSLQNKPKERRKAEYYAVRLKANEVANIGIDSLWFDQPLFKGEEQQRLLVRWVNYSERDVKNIPVTLWVDDQQKSIKNFNLQGKKSGIDTLFFSGIGKGWHKGKVQIKDYPVVFDDEYLFAFENKESLNVSVINGNAGYDPVSLAFSTDRFFVLHSLKESEINYGLFPAQNLIVLNNLQQVSDGLATQLVSYVKKGGQLGVFMPPNANIQNYQQLLKALKSDYPISWNNDTLKVDGLDWENQLLSHILETRQKRYELPQAAGYYELSRLTQTNRQVLVKAGAKNLWNAYRFGKGTVYLAAFILENTYSNFSRHGLFLPILYKMAIQNNITQKIAYELGEETAGLNDKGSIAESEILHLKGRGKDIIPSVEKTVDGEQLYFGQQIEEKGFYDLFKNQHLLQVLAFNDSRKESVRDFFSEKELTRLLGIQSAQFIHAESEVITNQIKEVNLGLSLWKLCLILALLCLAAEIVLIRFFTINKIQQV